MDGSSFLGKLKGFFKKYQIEMFILGTFLGLWTLFFLINPRAFTNIYTYTAYMSHVPFMIIPVLFLTYVIIAGEIDMSFPSVIGLGGWVFTAIWGLTGSPIAGLIIALVAGLLAGLFNGILVTKLHIPSLMLTIGTMYMWRGAIMITSEGLGRAVPLKRTTIGQIFVGRLGRVPVQIFWAVALAVVTGIILSRHKFGTHVYFSGDSPEAAKMLGVNISRVKIIAYTLLGVFSAFTGVLLVLDLSTFWPSLGEGYLLLVISSVIIGGTSIYGGAGSIFGSVIGALLIGILQTGILASGISGFFTDFVIGLIVVVAIVFQSIPRK